MWISGWCFCCLICLFQPFITLWVGKQSTMPFLTVVLLCFVFYFTTAGDMRNTYINATGIWWQNKWRPIMEAASNLLLSFVLIKHFRVAGILIATLVSLVFINLWYGSKILYTEYFKSQKFSDFILSHLQYFFVTVIVAAITYGCCYLFSTVSVFNLIIRLIICAIVPNLLYLLVYHRRPEFKSVKDMVSRIIRR